MSQVKRDLHVLISIAKLDASLNAARKELSVLPTKVARAKQALEDIAERERDSKNQMEEMTKEARTLEQQLEDNAEKTNKYRAQLMQVESNKEYTAMLHEIDYMEKDTDAKEERLLILMDELDREKADNETFLERSAAEKSTFESEITDLETRTRSVEGEVAKLESEKPKLLAELDPRIKKRYDRILAKMNDFAVTHIQSDICQGCFTRIPPQVAVEVRKNEELITCEACGRILVYYNA